MARGERHRLGLTLAAAFVFPGHGLIFAYLAVTVRLALYTQAAGWPGGEYFDQMLRLGLVAGFFEIFADYVLVRLLVSGRLVYLTRDAVLLESPLYMPFAWACVIVELGYVSVRLYSLFRGAPWGAWVASLVGGLTAGVFIGLYEYFAFRAGWWKYEPARVMIGPYCAAYIPLGECLMFLVMLPLLTWLGQRNESPVAAGLQWGHRLRRDHPGLVLRRLRRPRGPAVRRGLAQGRERIAASRTATAQHGQSERWGCGGSAPTQGKSRISTQFGFLPIGYSLSLVSLPLSGSMR